MKCEINYCDHNESGKCSHVGIVGDFKISDCMIRDEILILEQEILNYRKLLKNKEVKNAKK